MRFFIISLFTLSIAFANSSYNINYNNLTTQDLIKVTAKMLKKNIFFEEKVEGKVHFVSYQKIDKNNILGILKADLQTKGFSLKEYENRIIIKKDETDFTIVSIKNLDAKTVLDQLKEMLENKYFKELQLSSSITHNKENNSLMIVGSMDTIEIVKELISQLDKPQQQIYVEAKILEISKTKVNNIGAKYGLNGFNATGSTLTTLSSLINSSGSVDPLNLTELGIYGYTPLTMKHALSLGVAINLLNQNKALNVISEPSLLCLNNKTSSIYVGETQAIATGTTVGTTTTTNYQREDIGLKLSVTPRISKENKVTLSISTLLEDIKQTQTTLNGIPNTDKKEIITTAIVENGESVVLGGLIKNKLEEVEDRVPFFSSIPLFGEIFKNRYEINDKVNLVVIITPYIVPENKDLTFIRDQLAKLDLLTQKATQELETKLENNTTKR